MGLQSPTEKQARVVWFALTALAVATILALVAAACWGLGKILDLFSPVLWPLAIAAVVACLLSPLVDIFERKKIRRVRAILLVFAIALAVVLGILASILPQIVVETKDLASKIPEYSEKAQKELTEFIAQPSAFLRNLFKKTAPPNAAAAETPGDATTTNPPAAASTNGTVQASPGAPSAAAKQAALTKATDWFTASLPKIGSWLWEHVLKIFSGFEFLAGAVLVPIYAFYFLLEQRRIENRWRDYLPLKDSRAKEELVFVLDAISGYLITFFRGQVLVAICNGVLYTIGFLIIGVNYAFLFGLAATLLTMIPFLGAIIICVTALLLAFVQYGDGLHPALVLLVFAVVQSLEALVISPKIMGDRVGLHPLVIIIAVMAGTTVFGGILGGILAIPLAAALRVMLFRYVWKQPD
jgi:predicted PurR-regulated permease PerM